MASPSVGPESASKQSSTWSPQDVVASLPAHAQPPTGTNTSPIAFFHMLTRLKTTKREGWRRFGIAHGESISDHMYRMSILVMLAPPSLRNTINVERATKLALVHDMAELLVGDITPVDGVSKSEKSRREAATMDYLCKELLGSVDGGIHGQEIREAWQEYEDGETEESKFVHDIDKMELILQMVEYERASEDGSLHGTNRLPKVAGGVHVGEAASMEGGKTLPLDLSEFTWVAGRIQSQEVKAWARQVMEERKQFWEARGGLPHGLADVVD